MPSQTLRVESLAAVADGSPFADAWNAAALRNTDVFYQLAYLRVSAAHETGEIKLALYASDNGTVLYPFVLRPLDTIPGPAALLRGRYDIITPYEYGGPLLVAPSGPLAADFKAAFDAWCRDTGVVSEFVRFHPLLQNHLDWVGHYKVQHSTYNVLIDLQQTNETILAAMQSSTRRATFAALKRGLQVSQLRNVDQTARFARMYNANMERLSALPGYFFPSSYFAGLLQWPDIAGLYAATTDDDQWAGVASFLAGRHFVHYHLNAADRAYSVKRPANLLIWHAIQTFRATGRRWLHLGGAAPSQPGLRTFKDGYSSEHMNYYIGSRITDAALYRNLCECRGISTTSPGHFPAYRRPAPTLSIRNDAKLEEFKHASAS